MDLQQLFSAISSAIDAEWQNGFHPLSVTVSQRLFVQYRELYEELPYELHFSSDLRRDEFCISFRASPTNRHVNFYRVSNVKVPPATHNVDSRNGQLPPGESS